MSFTLRLLPIFAKLICIFARVMAKATTYLRLKSQCVCQYLGDGPIKGSLEQSALKQKKVLFISANLGPTVQLKVLSKSSAGIHTQQRLQLVRLFSVKYKFVRKKVFHTDKQFFIKMSWKRCWDT